MSSQESKAESMKQKTSLSHAEDVTRLKGNWTPGPWKWRFDEKQSDEKFKSALGLDGANNEDVIRLEDTYRGYPECGQELRAEISAEDANLILCSPDGLALAEMVMKLDAHFITMTKRNWNLCVVAALDLKAKAEGK